MSRAKWVSVGVVFAAAVAARLTLGTAGFDVGWDQFVERLARLQFAVVVGVALAGSGVALQALLRNPLAEPFILGLSTGAGAGIVAHEMLARRLDTFLGPTWLGALAGAAATMLIVYLAGRRRGVIDPLGLLLTGVVVGTINGAAVMIFSYLKQRGEPDAEALSMFMMGQLRVGMTGAWVFWSTAALTLAGLALLAWKAPAMDVATLSNAEAQALGVNLRALRALLFAVSSVLAAGAVVLAGPIAFVGLIAPHLGRLLTGPTHRPLLIVSALLGAALVVAADTVAAGLDYAFGFGLLPVGVFTAIVGGVAFLWMLRPQLGRGE